jgi:phosphoglycolate phosphatase
VSSPAAASGHLGAALIDLDGTLVDTNAGILAAIQAAFAEVTGEKPELQRVDLSLPLDETIRSVAPAVSESERGVLSAAFRRHYDSGHWRAAVLCAGATTCLASLRAAGIRTFVVTNKRTTAAERLLSYFNLTQYLEAIVGQAEGGAPVPKSELVKRCLADAALDPAATIVVGDSDQDRSAAASCRLPFLAVTCGAGPLGHAPIGDEYAHVRSLADVPAIVLRRLRGEMT